MEGIENMGFKLLDFHNKKNNVLWFYCFGIAAGAIIFFLINDTSTRIQNMPGIAFLRSAILT